MKEHKIPVTYVLYPDEGHGFRRPENRKSFNAVTEAFLAEQLGGRFEPVGDDFEGSTIAVPAGADDVPGPRRRARKRTIEGREDRRPRSQALDAALAGVISACVFAGRRGHNTRHEPHLCVLLLVYLYPPG